jgi:hypothetical protein
MTRHRHALAVVLPELALAIGCSGTPASRGATGGDGGADAGSIGVEAIDGSGDDGGSGSESDGGIDAGRDGGEGGGDAGRDGSSGADSGGDTGGNPPTITLPAPTGSDQTTTINGVLSSAAPGTTVLAQCGTYEHLDVIVIPAGVRLQGASGCSGGAQSELLWPLTNCTATGPGCLGANFPTSAVEVTGDGSSLTNMNVSSNWTGARSGTTWNGVNNGSAVAVYVTASNYLIDDVNVHVGAAAGIFTYMSSHGTIQNCSVDSSLADSISAGNGSTNLTVDHNVITNSGDDGISVDTYLSSGLISNDITITNNSVSGTQERCYYVSNANAGLSGNNYAVTITGNSCTNANNAPAFGLGTDSGSCNSGAHDVLIQDNTVTNAAYFLGIFADYVSSGTVGSCSAQDTDGSTHLTVTGNSATGIGFVGISIGTNYSNPPSDPSIQDVSITGNTLTAAASGYRSWGQLNGANVVVTGNTFTGFAGGGGLSPGTPGPIVDAPNTIN